jgi:integrase
MAWTRKLPSGRYQGCYRDRAGDSQTVGTFARKSDALNTARESESEIRRGVWADPKLAGTPFDTWASEWHKGRHKLGDVARRRDDSLLRLHVVGRDRYPWGFGSTPIGSIEPQDVRVWVNALVGVGYKPRTIRPCFRLLSAVMRSAVANKMILESPVTLGVVDLPQTEPKRERFLSPDEVERLALEHPPYYRPLVYTLAYAGLRWQEAAGLLRTNLDLDGSELHVRTVTERGARELKTLPKTTAGKRTVSLNPRLVEMLRFHLAGAPDSTLVFPSLEGHTLNESNFRRVWGPAVKRAGLEPLSVHDLRHTHASWLIEAGWPEFKIVRRLGWKDGRMLYTTYGHLLPGYDADLARGLDNLGRAAHMLHDDNTEDFPKLVSGHETTL